MGERHGLCRALGVSAGGWKVVALGVDPGEGNDSARACSTPDARLLLYDGHPGGQVSSLAQLATHRCEQGEMTEAVDQRGLTPRSIRRACRGREGLHCVVELPCGQPCRAP